ncbi:MAG: MBL fold metallo-hydrolase [Betaproteobacteria bacterium]|jgi:phosphoribosyl 1,2-cyclic phosphodiesterase
MRFAYLGSGSQGNALVVEAAGTRILLDCGFTLRESDSRLGRLGLSGADLDGIVVTHEHDDHLGGVGRLARKYDLPVWLTRGTFRQGATGLEGLDLRFVDGYRAFEAGALQVRPYPVPHDAGEPAQYVFSDGARRLGVLTDAGSVTSHMREVLDGCDALALECNHDRDLLLGGAYPATLKERIAGRFGHLDNGTAASLLGSLNRTRLQHVVAVHLSLQNNTADLARQALAAVLGCAPDWVAVADQFAGLGWRDIQ